MDRIREGRRGSSVGGSASAPRRPRTTGLKDSSGMDDGNTMDVSNNSRLREKTKKESSGISSLVYSVNNSSNSRNKRRRQGASIHPRSTTEDADESSEEMETGVSEDDDDVPPMSRRQGKLKFQGKHPNEGSTIDISAVPRKARTAMSKRPFESPSPPVGVKQPFPSSDIPSAVTHSVLSPSRSGRRMKPCGPKSRALKLTKVSATQTSISEQEVEIAEALFDLARTVPSQARPSVSEWKIDSTVETKPEANVIVPVTPITYTSVPFIPGQNHSSSPASPLPGPACVAPVLGYDSRSSPAGSTCSVQVSGPFPAEAPKKRPHVKTVDDAVSIHMNSSRPLCTNSGGIFSDHSEENVQTAQSLVAEKVMEMPESTSVLPINNSSGSPHAMSSLDTSFSPSRVQRYHIMENRSSGVGETVVMKSENADNTLIEKSPASPVLTEKKVSSGHTNSNEEDNEAVGDSSSFGNFIRRISHPPGSSGAHHVKFETDLIEMPKQILGVATLEMEKTDDDTSCLGILETGDIKGGRGETIVQGESLNKREIEETEMLDSIYIKDIKQLQITESSATPSHPCSNIITSIAVSNATVRSPSLPASATRSPSLPISMAGWPGNLPSGFFSPVAAAAWPATSFSGTVCADQRNSYATRVSSFAFQGVRNPWKRCSSHVFIAHYIDLQQQIQRHHPLWVAAYGSTAASLYGAKPYNLNIPVSASDAIFSNGTDAMTSPSGSTIVGPATKAPNPGTGPASERYAVTTANVQGLTEKDPSAYYDTLAKTGLLPQSIHTGQQSQQHPLSLSLQAGPAFGFPITQGAATISNALSSVHGAGTAANATAISIKSGSESDSTNAGGTGVMVGSALGTTNSSAVNEVASQVQYLQAMMQHNSFPFSFQPMHFGPGFSGPPGHISQQATQLFSNPFYGPHLVHPSLHLQQKQVDASAGLVSSLRQQQQQQQQQQPGLRIQSLTPPQEQQQQTHPLSSSQSQVQHTLGTHSHHYLSEKEGNVGRESTSFTESKATSLQRSMYNHTIPSIHASEMSSASVFAVSAPALLSLNSQDLNFMGAVGPKQNAKLHRQQQQASRQLQPPQQVPISSQQHRQQLVTAQHHTLSPALSTNIKNLEPQAYSNLFLSSLTNSAVGPGPLGLAPVAAVMAPQGHAMLQTAADFSRIHTQSSHQLLSKQPHHVLVQGQNQRSAVGQRTNLSAANDQTMDEVSFTGSNRMQDLPEERKTPIQRSIDTLSNSEVASSIQGSLNSGNVSGLAVSHGLSTSANTIASMTNFTCHHNGQLTTSVSLPITSVSQLLKPSLGQTKTSSNAASPSASADSSVGSFTDRTLGTSQNRHPASGAPSSGKTSSQILRHGQTTHAQQVAEVKSAQRSSTLPNMQTPPSSLTGSAVPRHQVQSHSRAQQIPMTMAPGSRLLPTLSSMPLPSSPVSRHCSPSIPLSPLPPVLKSSMAASAKSIAPTKNSSTHMQKMSGTNSTKRSTSVISPTSSATMAPVGQNIPGKSAYPQQYHQQIHHGMQLQQHLPEAVQQSQSTLTVQQVMPQQYGQHQSNAIQPPTNLLHRKMLQSQHSETRRQLPVQQQQLYLQHQHDLNQSQSVSPQNQGFVHPPQQFHGQQSQYPLSISSQSQQQHIATVQQVHKLAQSHQGLQLSHHLALEDLTSAADSNRALSTEAVAAGYQSVASKSLKLSGNVTGSGAQRNNVGTSFLQAASATVGQQSIVLGTCADAAYQEPRNSACLMSVALSGRQSQSPLPSSPHRLQALKHASGESIGPHLVETLSISESPILNSSNIGMLSSNSHMNTDLTSVNGKCIPGSSSQYQSASTPGQPVITIATSVAAVASVTSGNTGVLVAQCSTGLVQP